VPAAHVRVRDYSADGVRRSLEASLRRLGLDRIDIALIHDPDDHGEQALREAYPTCPAHSAAPRARGSLRGVRRAAAAVAARFPLRHPAVASVLIGARSAAEIGDAVRLRELDIPAALWTAWL
jgi:D-threo-aldose 1-dehydrogenase